MTCPPWARSCDGLRCTKNSVINTCAREIQVDTIVDEILDIADDGSNDWMETERGKSSITRLSNGRASELMPANGWLASCGRGLREKVETTHELGDTFSTVAAKSLNAGTMD